jgi:hypothetical protein
MPIVIRDEPISVPRRRPAVSWMIACACLAAIAVGALVAGCGSGSTGPSETRPTVGSLVKTMREDFQHAKSLRLSGHVPVEGKPLAVDLKLLRSGDSAGQMTLNGATFRFVRVGSQTYVYVSRSFFRYLRSSRRVPSSACALICGKYVKLPVGAIPGLTLDNLAKMIDKHLSVPRETPLVSVTTFNGQPAYKLSRAGQAAFFAKNGHHYLIGYRATKQGVTMSFSQWNSVPPISPPPASKIVNIG